jgi:hypothetical protein
MSVLQLTPQFRENETHTAQSLTLDGIRIQLTTYTNKSDDNWYADIRDSDGEPLILALALVPGLDLLHRYRYLPVPPGQLIVVDQTQGPPLDPTLESFINGDSGLFYLTADTVYVPAPEPEPEEIVISPPPA